MTCHAGDQPDFVAGVSGKKDDKPMFLMTLI
jgi:hypothetical protein